MMLFEVILILTCLAETMKCLVVIDKSSQNQKGVFMGDYCPKMKYCPEGAHVMCMFYNPANIMGPQCHHPRNVSISPELANKLLDVSNAVRSKIARGQEKGKNNEHFPRGYGIFRLKWDTELATFAQVLANQCMLRHDLCRATQRFHEPGQTVSLVRFSDPDWIPISKSSKLTAPGLDSEKLMHATIQSLKAWYGHKNSVTTQMLNNYSDWESDPHKPGRLYMEMIYGPSTHMGCGISAYNEYAFHDNNASLSYNAVQVVCNYSGRPKKGGAVYNTVPATDTASTFNQCGCPAGSVEDDDCLCHEVPKELVSEPLSLGFHKTRKCGNTKYCDPTVVLLPIFTVENAPHDNLIYSERLPNSSFDQIRRLASDSFEKLLDNNVSRNMKKMHESPNTEDHSNTGSNGNKLRAVSFNHVSVRNRHFDKNQNDLKNYETPNDYENTNPRKSFSSNLPRPSIFAKTPRFQLPGTRNILKLGVVPRKDFPKGKKLVGKYSYNKKYIVLPEEAHQFIRNHRNTMTSASEINSAGMLNQNHDLQKYLHPKVQKHTNIYHKDLQFNDILTTESVLNTAEQIVINHNDHMKDFNITHDLYKIDNMKNTTEENDNKFMTILDTLEREVRLVELQDKEKVIVDAKLKKIYGKIIGASRKILDTNEVSHEKNNETKQETLYELKFERKQKAIQETSHETKIEIKDESKDELKNKPKHDPEHRPKHDLTNEPKHESTHINFDVDANEHGKKSKDNKEHDNSSEDDNSVHKLEPLHDKFKYENDFSDHHNSHKQPQNNIHDLETEGLENYRKHDTKSSDIELFNLNERPVSKNNKNGDKTHIRFRQNIRQKNTNEINSLEYFRHPYDNGYRERKSLNKNRHFQRNMLRNDIEKPKHRSNSLDRRFSRTSHGFDWYDDPLSAERRKYYQDKLDDMERKLRNVRHNAQRKDANRPRHLRALRPKSMHSETQMASINTAGRARFLHAY